MINKFQQGGSSDTLKQIMQIMQLAKAAGKGDQKAILALSLVAQQVGPQGLMQIALMGLLMDPEGAKILAGIANKMTQSARLGAKLNYLKKISNLCPDGTQLVYFQAGGQICSKCRAILLKSKNVIDGIKKELMQSGGKTPKKNNKVAPKKPIIWTLKDDDKYGKLISKSVNKNKLTPQEKKDSIYLSNKFKNASNSKDFEVVDKCGGKIKKKKHLLGGIITSMTNLNNLK